MIFFVKLENLVKISKDDNGQNNKNEIKALDTAINCKHFHRDGDRNQQHIYFWTQDQGFISKEEFSTLTDAWHNPEVIDQTWKKLWLHTQKIYPWMDINMFWDNVVFYR